MKYEIEYKGKTYPVKFRHDRATELIEIEYGDIKEIFKKRILATGGKTIAYITLEDETTIEGVAECSDKDVYCKHRGRMISLGRLKQRIKKGDIDESTILPDDDKGTPY